MDYNTIKKLLDKYWEGQTSVNEEAQLKNFFNQEEVPASLKEYQPLFVYLKDQQSLQMSDDFEKRLKAKLGVDEKPIARQRRLPFYLVRIAAAAVLIFGVFFLIQKNDSSQPAEIVWEDTYEDPQQAYLKAKETLLLLSRKLNKGTNTAATSLKKGEKATQRIKK